MGLLSKLGGAAKEGLRNGAVNGLLNAAGYGAMTGEGSSEYEYDANGRIKGVNAKYAADVANRYVGGFDTTGMPIYGKTGGLTSSRSRYNDYKVVDEYPIKYKSQRDKTKSSINEKNKDTAKSAYGLLLNDQGSNTIVDYESNKIAQDPLSDIFKLKLPDWTYADFINERAIWQKGLSSIFDEPAWFYFKIFFDFDTQHGLFGGLLNSEYLTSATNSAAKYLYSVRKYHKQEKPKDRINALYKFASLLSYINTNAPWYFKGIKNLNNAMGPFVDEFSKEKYIEIETLPDAIDMRLSTLMSLYNYACYDSILGKEIIPQNLRKFNMSIILFQTPLRYLHTSYITNEKKEFMGINLTGIQNMFGKNNAKNGKVNYKSMTPTNGTSDNFADMMSMHVFSFYGCEFAKETIGSMIPADISNENPFQLGNNTIKITYTSCQQHTMNEFFAMMYGSDGFYFNQYSNFSLNDWDGYVNENKDAWGRQVDRYNALSNLFENIMSGGTILGLIDSPTTYKRAIDATEALMNGLYEDNNLLKDIGVNFALGLLGSSKSTDAPQGNIYGDYGIGSAYYKDKLEMLKNGVHERTQAPYYYDPDTGVKREFHVNRSYSAYNFKNDVNTISSFNVVNWLDTQTQKAASWINDQVREGVGIIRDAIEGNHLNTTPPYKPNQYNSNTAQETDAKKWEGVGKSHDMVDDPNTWNRVEKPFTLNPTDAVTYERNKQIDLNNGNQTDIRYDEEGNKYHLFGTEEKSQFVQDPYMYNAYNNLNANDIDTKKFEDVGKSHDMVDDPNTWNRVEKPYNYNPNKAVEYENSKAGDKDKIQVMTDGIGNENHQVTEAPFAYDPVKAVEYENSKAGDKDKIQVMTDGIGNEEHQVTEAPFTYDPVKAVEYENSKAGGEGMTQILTDGIGNAEHEITEAPYNYDPKSALYTINTSHESTEAPFDYNSVNAVEYENSKAGGEGKTQVLTDGIGNAEHEITEAPFDYDPANAVNYENSKAGGEGKTQVLTDGIGNAEHEITEAPYDYDPTSIDYTLPSEHAVTEAPYNYDPTSVDYTLPSEHAVTEAPYNYDPNSVNYVFASEHAVTEAPYNYDPLAANYIFNSEHNNTEAPFMYDSVNAINYENNKLGEHKDHSMVDGLGNPEHEFTETPYLYDSINAVQYEVNKQIDHKDHSMVDGLGNPEHEFTLPPYTYDGANAIQYEQNKKANT